MQSANFFSINAGCTALPALLNINHAMLQRQVTGIWDGKDELPVSVTPNFLDMIIINVIKFTN